LAGALDYSPVPLHEKECPMFRVPCEARDSTPDPPGISLFHPALSDTLEPKEPTMTIEIRDSSLEARIRKQLRATGSSSVEEVLLRSLDRQEEQDHWLLEVRLATEEKPS
jgi:hypothetical protein